MTEYPVNNNIDPSLLAPKGDLYPKFWDAGTKKLNNNIRIKLKEIAESFAKGFDYPLVIKDIILTGSLANYNWNQFSDIDLHILVDFSEIPNEYMEAFRDYFDAKKQIWNKTHNINILGHEVEIYIQDSNEPHHSTGIYSVMNDRWNKESVFTKQDIDYEDVAEKTEYFIDQINKINDLFSKKDFQKAKTGADKIREKIKKYRQAGLESEGEYSTENLVFKMLRNSGYLETLSNLKIQSSDLQMGIEEEIFAIQNILEEEKKKTNKDRCYKLAKQKYDVFPSAYASGFIVRCRQGKVAKKKNEDLELDEETIEELSQLEEKDTFSKEKESGLHGWFSRQGGTGKSKGWVDCNTCRKDKKTGKKTCKTCGRGEGEKRSKYPACRPTPSACTKAGTKRKKSSKPVSWKSKKEE